MIIENAHTHTKISMVKHNMNLTKKHFSLKHMRSHGSRDRQFNDSKWTFVRGQPSAGLERVEGDL